MSRYIPNCQSETVFNIVEQWKEKCLLAGGSLFSSRNLWAADIIIELIEHYVKKPDVGENDFWKKLEIQLKPTSENAKILAAEILYILYLPFHDIRKKTRLEDINKILGWTDVDLIGTDHHFFNDDIFVGTGGELSKTHRWRELNYCIRLIKALLTSNEKRELLSDSVQLAKWMEGIDDSDKRQFRHTLLYMLFPDKFERVFSNQHRKLIIQSFRDKEKISASALSTLNTDRLLSEIREEMERKHDTEEIDFYHPPLSKIWRPDKSSKDSTGSEQKKSSETTKSSASTQTSIRKSVNSINCIYYGPPGTGKTWNTVNHAVAIIAPESKNENRKEINEWFDKLKMAGRIEMVTFHQNYTYEEFIEGIRPVLSGKQKTGDGEQGDKIDIKYELSEGIFKRIAKRAKKNSGQKYVLIIDEINRGNIAKIFGELITLIEESKRLENNDQATTVLPYSKESFGVPNNLYIVGTMNTADRSIALLDTALRRRFDFIEMMPKPDLLKDVNKKELKGVNCQQLLSVMNERIHILHDRDHQIGHTYFLDVENMDSLAKTFKNKIIPLLQEYFYDNWVKIDLVLNKNGFIHEISVDEKLIQNSDFVDTERKFYELLPADNGGWHDPQRYRQIYRTGTQLQQEGQDNQVE